MRQDQFEKLQLLSEKLTDVFLTEASPDKWPGASVNPDSWDQQTRGDRYWMKKNAAATLSVIMKTVNLVGVIQQRGNVVQPEGDSVNDDDGNLDKEIANAEKEANKLLNKLQKVTHG